MRKTDVEKIKELVHSLYEAYELSLIKDENVALHIKKLSETIDNILKMDIICSSKFVAPPRRSYIIIDPVTANNSYKNLITIQGVTFLQIRSILLVIAILFQLYYFGLLIFK